MILTPCNKLGKLLDYICVVSHVGERKSPKKVLGIGLYGESGTNFFVVFDGHDGRAGQIVLGACY
jgi:serine/threonine protein phosphatase PrpC|tara:strand:- start:9750 stop:9944 length:195 start_codon:yes stop_codon:yes gene_type:complete